MVWESTKKEKKKTIWILLIKQPLFSLQMEMIQLHIDATFF
jgi:hypothetical protein